MKDILALKYSNDTGVRKEQESGKRDQIRKIKESDLAKDKMK